MIRIFRANQPVTALLLLVYAALLRAVALRSPFDDAAWNSPAARIVHGLLNALPVGGRGVAGYVLSVLCCVSAALYVNGFLNRYKLNYSGGYLAAFAFVLASSFLPAFAEFTPPLLALVPLLAGFDLMARSYRTETAIGAWFDAGFMVGLSLLVYFPFAAFALFVAVGFLIIRPLNLRELLMGLVGVALPVFLIAVMYYWYNRLPLLLSMLPTHDWLNRWRHALPLVTPALLQLSPLLALLVVTMLALPRVRRAAVMQHRVVMSLVPVFVAAGVLSTALMPGFYAPQFVWLAAPLAMLLTWTLPEVRRAPVAEVLHLCLILLLVFVQYFYPATVT